MNANLMGEVWYNTLREEVQQPYFLKLKETLRKEYTTLKCYPRPDHIFRAFQLTTPETIRVVIVGLDPYPFGDHADGIAFSSQLKETPYSLQRIFREADRDVVKTKSRKEFLGLFPTNDLSGWAKQGVFLLNSTLTVRAGQVGSHAEIGWQQFNTVVLQTIANINNPVIFCLWGSAAQNLAKGITFGTNNKILEAGHPASGSHGKDRFSGCNHFSKINYHFWRNDLPEINWTTNNV